MHNDSLVFCSIRSVTPVVESLTWWSLQVTPELSLKTEYTISAFLPATGVVDGVTSGVVPVPLIAAFSDRRGDIGSIPEYSITPMLQDDASLAEIVCSVPSEIL